MSYIRDMKKATTLRRAAPLALAGLLATLMLASCTSTRKYGCPNHVNGPSSYSSR
jgi:hypothetical protein